MMELAPSALCEPPETFVPGEISSDGFHEGLDWISGTGDKVIFTRVAPDFSTSEIYFAAKKAAGWRSEKLPFSNGGYDAGVVFSKDMKRLILTSTRESDVAPEGNWNIWSVSVSTEGAGWRFGEAAFLNAPVNTDKNECCAVFGKGGEIFFSSDRNGPWSLYRALPAANGYIVEKLEGRINTDDGAWPSAYIEESDTLLFSSIRKSGAGGDDIYASTRVDGRWTEARMLGGPVNKSGYEDGARVFDGTFYWSSRPVQRAAEDPMIPSDIFYMSAVCAAEGSFSLE